MFVLGLECLPSFFPLYPPALAGGPLDSGNRGHTTNIIGGAKPVKGSGESSRVIAFQSRRTR